MSISLGDQVKIHYTIKDMYGEIIESSHGYTPMSLKIEKQQFFGTAENLVGLKKGDKKEFTVPPDKGFGERREEFYREVPKELLKGKEELSEGMVIELKAENQKSCLALIDEIKKDTVVLDLNHPLAGETVKVNIEIVDVLTH